jgi:23S rRNA (adenine2503-C2)-methyltransferase
MPAYRAAQVLHWVYQRGAVAFAEMTDLPAVLRRELESEFLIRQLRPEAVARADDGTRKLLFRLDDGNAIESVLIPDPPRLTLCISSQAGCGMGCRFCATARLGLRRNLGANEIVGQVLAARRELNADERITNVVFMGMGEPLHNYDAVVGAIEILMASWGCGFSSRRITVSTVGLLPQLERLAKETPVNLAVSLVATNNEVRGRLMPVNRRYPIEKLISVCRKLPIPQRRRITFEYVMLAGINDTLDDANRLIHLLHGIPSKVNLIPFNPFPGTEFAPSSPETIRAFQTRLLEGSVNATVRISRGRDVQAACGQLAAAVA